MMSSNNDFRGLNKVDWSKKHIIKCNTLINSQDEEPSSTLSDESDGDNLMDHLVDWTPQGLRKTLEPWLSAVFQSEHFSLLTGTGLTAAICNIAQVRSQGMGRLDLSDVPEELYDLKENIISYSEMLAKDAQRGEANIEDDFNVAFKVIEALRIIKDERADIFEKYIEEKLKTFIDEVIETERKFINRNKGLVDEDVIGKLAQKVEKEQDEIKEMTAQIISSLKEDKYLDDDSFITSKLTADLKLDNIDSQKYGELSDVLFKGNEALQKLKSFLISFSSRAASRERLNIFTTNYDRFIEYGLDSAGILTIDRFIGKLKPKLRTTKLELDYHYNPPGIRGEPRFVEGVVKLTKLHGSIDWQFEENDIYKQPLAFGAGKEDSNIPKNPKRQVVIYPNSAKGIDTALFPYAELFRDFSSSICRPNSVVITYGYGFGDSHINRILSDMLTIPSTHLIVIAWDMKNEGAKESPFGPGRDRIQEFYSKHNTDQITLMIGSHFGDLSALVDNYLPKAAIDRIQEKALKFQERHYGARDNQEIGKEGLHG